MSGEHRARVGWVFLHGFAGGPVSWDAVLAALPSDDDVPVLRLALPGHDAGAPVFPAFDGNVDWVAEQIAVYGNARWHVVGYSLGARLALGLLARHARLCAAVTLISVNPGLTTSVERRERAAWDDAWARLLRQRGIRAFVDEWERLPLFGSQHGVAPARLQGQRRIRLAHDPERLAHAVEGLGLAHMPDYRNTLRQTRVPLHVVVGALDAKFCALASSVAAECASARVTVIPDCGHNPLIECPERLADLLSSTRAFGFLPRGVSDARPEG